MIKKFNLLFTLLIISVFLIGCTNGEDIELSKKNESEVQTDKEPNHAPASTKGENEENAPSQEENEEKIPSKEEEKGKLLNKFQEKFPDAVSYNDTMVDIDKDNSEELLVIFDTPEKKVNVAFLSDIEIKGFSIGEGNGYSFDYIKDSLIFDESTNSFFITVHDENHKITVDYKITVETAEENKETNFKVESLNERKD